MKFLLGILCFGIIIKLNSCEVKNVTTEDMVDNTSKIDLKDALKKYSKYMVYIYGKKRDLQQFWVGVILRSDIILSAYIDHGKSEENKRVLSEEFSNTTVETFIRFGRVTPANIRTNKSTNLKKAINLSPTVADVPQLSVVKLQHKITLSDKVAVVHLPNHTYHKNDICVTLGWGSNGTESTLTPEVVVIEEECGKGVICFAQYNKSASLKHCELYAGGEPLFCSGTLVGIVSYSLNCDNSKLPQATSVYDYVQWIEEKILELDEQAKSGCVRILCKISFILCAIFIFI